MGGLREPHILLRRRMSQELGEFLGNDNSDLSTGGALLANLICLAAMNALSSRFITPDRIVYCNDVDALDLALGI